MLVKLSKFFFGNSFVQDLNNNIFLNAVKGSNSFKYSYCFTNGSTLIRVLNVVSVTVSVIEPSNASTDI